jgi:hypothetical protein
MSNAGFNLAVERRLPSRSQQRGEDAGVGRVGWRLRRFQIVRTLPCAVLPVKEADNVTTA